MKLGFDCRESDRSVLQQDTDSKLQEWSLKWQHYHEEKCYATVFDLEQGSGTMKCNVHYVDSVRKRLDVNGGVSTFFPSHKETVFSALISIKTMTDSIFLGEIATLNWLYIFFLDTMGSQKAGMNGRLVTKMHQDVITQEYLI